MEGVAELVGLGLVDALAAGAAVLGLVLAEGVPLELAEDVLEGLLADAADGAGGELVVVASRSMYPASSRIFA